ncbi:MAG TPA: Crp/Fnr family transcriptional regulator [Puia sp.]|uniref:Crp/Fnr family transcriptional regulator n=1 Tax=Puia sp. TaxID=2045100 RepID=UPI002C2E9ED6|nr:Crp/Fnr family transcriptional regulator [Puia sp.]HVU94315.1 Crp/Fnr family transcriptional regulator [Puia sp.]
MSINGLFPIEKWNFKSRSILDNLPEEDQALLLGHQTEQTYGKGEIVFREGGLPTGIFYIIEGKVKKYKADYGGGEPIIYVAGSGELIGYQAVLSGERFPDSAATLEKSVIAFIPREAFLAVLQQSTVLNGRLLQLLGHEFTVFVNNLTLFSQRPVRERFALQLVVLREKYKPAVASEAPVEINLSREDLANLVGTRRENIVRILADFKDEGILVTRGRKIIVQDVRQLIRIANFK